MFEAKLRAVYPASFPTQSPISIEAYEVHDAVLAAAIAYNETIAQSEDTNDAIVVRGNLLAATLSESDGFVSGA
jgi:hypothetical protein